MKEIWKPVPIPHLERLYSVSNLGRIKSHERKVFYENTRWKSPRSHTVKERIMSARMQKNGYLLVGLKEEQGKARKYLVHRLVALAFIKNPLNKSDVNHKNSIRSDNQDLNLEWVTPSENQIHASKYGNLGKCERHWNNKLSREDVLGIRKMAASGIVQRRIAEKFKVSYSTVCNIVSGKSRQA